MKTKELHTFFCSEVNNGIAKLTEDESLHACKVLRLATGSKMNLIDGKGGYFEGVLEHASPKHALVKIEKETFVPQVSGRYLKLAVSPTKNSDRMEWMVEKAVEIGIEEISFFYTQRCERNSMNMDRIEKVVIAAMKQSKKYYLPKLTEFKNIDQLLGSLSNNEFDVFLAHLDEGERYYFANEINTLKKTCVLIGPEGDFTPEEIISVKQFGGKAISLGASRLRTETAGVFACSQYDTIFKLNQLKEYV